MTVEVGQIWTRRRGRLAGLRVEIIDVRLGGADCSVQNIQTRAAWSVFTAFIEKHYDREETDMSNHCRQVLSDGGGICALHGGAWTPEGCVTQSVLESVAEHRVWQYEHHGANRAVPDGTGQHVQWLAPVADWINHWPGTNPGATRIEDLFRHEWDFLNDGTDEQKTEAMDTASWMRMVREEIAEAFKEADSGPLAFELTQAAALIVSWLEKIREREIWQYGASSWDGESVYADPDWHCAADVMVAQHGMGGPGPVRVWRRHVGGEWERMPS